MNENRIRLQSTLCSVVGICLCNNRPPKAKAFKQLFFSCSLERSDYSPVLLLDSFCADVLSKYCCPNIHQGTTASTMLQ